MINYEKKNHLNWHTHMHSTLRGPWNHHTLTELDCLNTSLTCVKFHYTFHTN